VTTGMRTVARLALPLAAACLAWTALPVAAETAIVTTRVVYPGETLAPDVLEEVPFKRGNRKLAPVAQQFRELDGKVAKRTILPGRLVPLASIREAWLVERGKAVTLIFDMGSMRITAKAVTLDNGIAGDSIRARNVDSGKIISGTVLADGSVQVGMQ